MKNTKQLKAICFLLFFLLILVALSVGIYNIYKTIKIEDELAAEYNVSMAKVMISKPANQYYDIRTEVDSELSFNVSCLSNRIKGSFGEGCYYLYTVANSDEAIASIGMVDTWSYSPLGSGKMYKVYVKDKKKVPNEAKAEVVEYVELYDYLSKKSIILDLDEEQISYLINELVLCDSQAYIESRQADLITIDEDYECRFFVKGIPGLYFKSRDALSIVYDEARDKFYISSEIGTTNWYKKIPNEFQRAFKNNITVFNQH